LERDRASDKLIVLRVDNKQIKRQTYHHVLDGIVFLRPLFPSLDCGAAAMAATTTIATQGNSNDIYVVAGGGRRAAAATRSR
jgi:hypothetical protein